MASSRKINFIWRLLMKNLFSKSLPILFLVISLSFMTFFHHEDELSDREVDEFETLNNQDHTVDPRSETEVEYTTTSDGEVVSIYDEEDNQVSEIPQEDWENNKDYYRSEEHTSELQSRGHLVCRLLL